MADVTIGAKLSLDAGAATTSVKSFKQELQLAQKEVVELTNKFGATSAEAVNAAKKAAQLKDAIGDAKSLVDAFNPDTKFRAFGASINTVVGGFTALQGVMGLVGVESNEVQKALVKVQSALALSQGIAQLQEGVQTFKNLGAVIQQTTIFQKANAAATAVTSTVMKAFGVNVAATSTAFNVLKGAIIATGIGALVVGLTLVVQNLNLFSDAADEAAKAQARLNNEIKAANELLEDEMKIYANEEKLEVARAKRRGASEAEIFQIQQRYRRLNAQATADSLAQISDINSEGYKKLKQQLDEFNTEGQVAQIEFETAEAKRRKDAAEKAAEEAKKARAKLLKDAEDELKTKQADFTAKGGAGAGLNVEIPKTLEQLQIEAAVAAQAKATEDKEKLFLAESDARSAAYNAQKDQIKELEAAEEAAYQTRKTLLESTGNLFSVLGGIVGRETAAGKVLGIAQATINTFIGATEVLRAKSTLPEPAGTISKIVNVAAVIATGLAAVRNIVKTPVPGASGGSVPAVPAPLQPQKPQGTTTTLDQQSLNAIGNATTRAFVLEADVTSNQERVTRLNRAARLGG